MAAPMSEVIEPASPTVPGLSLINPTIDMGMLMSMRSWTASFVSLRISRSRRDDGGEGAPCAVSFDSTWRCTKFFCIFCRFATRLAAIPSSQSRGAWPLIRDIVSFPSLITPTAWSYK